MICEDCGKEHYDDFEDRKRCGDCYAKFKQEGGIIND